MAQGASRADLSSCWWNLTHVELLAGRWLSACAAAASAQAEASGVPDNELECDSFSLSVSYATALWGLGRIAEVCKLFPATAQPSDKNQLSSFRDFDDAELKQSVPMPDFWDAERKFLTEDRTAARSEAEASRKFYHQEKWTDGIALCDSLLGRCACQETRPKPVLT
jgi:hypothetical protein